MVCYSTRWATGHSFPADGVASNSASSIVDDVISLGELGDATNMTSLNNCKVELLVASSVRKKAPYWPGSSDEVRRWALVKFWSNWARSWLMEQMALCLVAGPAWQWLPSRLTFIYLGWILVKHGAAIRVNVWSFATLITWYTKHGMCHTMSVFVRWCCRWLVLLCFALWLYECVLCYCSRPSYGPISVGHLTLSDS